MKRAVAGYAGYDFGDTPEADVRRALVTMLKMADFEAGLRYGLIKGNLRALEAWRNRSIAHQLMYLKGLTGRQFAPKGREPAARRSRQHAVRATGRAPPDRPRLGSPPRSWRR